MASRPAWHANCVSDTQPEAGQPAPEAGQAPPDADLTQPQASRLALIAEATKRAGLIWITVPGHGRPGGAGTGGGEAAPGRPRAAWHVWRDAAYVLTGPGEQDVPGLGDVGQVTVTVPSKDTGGLLMRWTAQVSRVEPDSAKWPEIIGALLAARLNESASPGEPRRGAAVGADRGRLPAQPGRPVRR